MPKLLLFILLKCAKNESNKPEENIPRDCSFNIPFSLESLNTNNIIIDINCLYYLYNVKVDILSTNIIACIN